MERGLGLHTQGGVRAAGYGWKELIEEKLSSQQRSLPPWGHRGRWMPPEHVPPAGRGRWAFPPPDCHWMLATSLSASQRSN